MEKRVRLNGRDEEGIWRTFEEMELLTLFGEEFDGTGSSDTAFRARERAATAACMRERDKLVDRLVLEECRLQACSRGPRGVCCFGSWRWHLTKAMVKEERQGYQQRIRTIMHYKRSGHRVPPVLLCGGRALRCTSSAIATVCFDCKSFCCVLPIAGWPSAWRRSMCQADRRRSRVC